MNEKNQMLTSKANIKVHKRYMYTIKCNQDHKTEILKLSVKRYDKKWMMRYKMIIYVQNYQSYI